MVVAVVVVASVVDCIAISGFFEPATLLGLCHDGAAGQCV